MEDIIREENIPYEHKDTRTEKAKAIATIVVVAIVNVLNVLGYAVDADAWINAVTSILSAASIVYAWWKNQNFTDEAIAAQGILDGLKAKAKHAKEDE